MALRQDHQLAHMDAYAVNKSDNALLLKHAGIATAAKVVKSKLLAIDENTKALLIRWLGSTPGVSINSGNASITDGNTSVSIIYGLDKIISAKDIKIIMTNNPINDPGNIWVSNINSVQFTVNCRNNPGVSGLDFAWRVLVFD